MKVFLAPLKSCVTGLRSGTLAARMTKERLLADYEVEQAHGVPRVDRSQVLSGKIGRKYSSGGTASTRIWA